MEKTREERLRDLERERQLFTARLPDPYAAIPTQIRYEEPKYSQAPLQNYAPFPSEYSPSYVEPSSYQPPSSYAREPPSSYPRDDQNYTRDDDESEPHDDVCFATEGGLKGKIKLTRDGKHSFIDMESHPITPQYPGSLSRSLTEFSKAEKARLKAEKQVSQQEAYHLVRDPSPSRSQRLPEKKSSVDAFHKLLTKEQKSRAKALLEEERVRYAQLEDAYHKLLLQVQHLQQSHLADIRNTETRFHSSSSTLQKALVLKSEETSSLSTQLLTLQTKYEKEHGEWGRQKSELTANVDRLEKGFDDVSKKLDDREKKMTDLNRIRKELSTRLATRETELVKYGKALREKEGDYLKEKESRMKHEVKALKLDEILNERDVEMRQVKEHLNRKTTEVEDLSKAKIGLNEAKRELEELTRREKNYLLEIETSAQRERKLFAEVEELASQQRKYVTEISRLTSRQTTLAQDVEMYKSSEQKLSDELQSSLEKTAAQDDHLVDLEKQIRQYQQDSNRFLQSVADLQNALAEMRAQNKGLEAKNAQYIATTDTLMNDKEQLIMIRNKLEAEQIIRDREVEELRIQVDDLSARLENELHSKIELKNQGKEKLTSVSSRLNDLQATLSETQAQMQDLRDNESTLRLNIRQREEALRTQNTTIVELQTRLADLSSQVSRDTQEHDIFKARKREEILSIQEKFNTAKTAMEQEVTALRSQLQQKLSQMANVTEESSRVKVELSEAGADRYSLEARISELLASEASYQRQIAALQNSLNSKNQELSRILSKQTALADQVRRVEEENSAYRGGQAVARDSEIHKLQNNMDEISRRLKTQVDVLLDRDVERVASPIGSKPPTSEYGNRSRTSSAAAYDRLGSTSTKPRFVAPRSPDRDSRKIIGLDDYDSGSISNLTTALSASTTALKSLKP